MKNNTFHVFELAIYYVIIFFLLREWLVPIMELTNTGFIELIMLFIVMCLGMNLIRIHVLIKWSIKLLYIVWFVVFVYGQMSVFTLEGIQFLLGDLQFNMLTIIQLDLVQVTDPFRTLLFLILIWMLVYLIHHWINVRMSIFFFLFLTVLFVATLDTFTPYNGLTAIVRVIFLGLVLSASLLIKRLMHQKKVKFEAYKYASLIVSVVFLVSFISGIAYFLPKPEPKWPDPVPFIKAAAGKGGPTEEGRGVKKVGYGNNDEQLGGGFVEDDSVVFLVEANSRQYWRVETKDTYTTKGWIKSPESMSVLPNEYYPGEQIYHSVSFNSAEDSTMETATATIHNLSNHDFILQPYGLISVDVAEEIDSSLFKFRLDLNEKLSVYQYNNKVVLSNYQVQYNEPTYYYSELMDTSFDESYYVDDVDERYLQLPNTLPNRVRDLAKEIVSGKETAYEKARAIETYFKQNGFKYSKDDVAIPSENQDYVDQFLFETKVGYCDNFSTAMVVMLRSVGIEARWVKGFAPGELVGNDDGIKTYQVTNNNAHSWVEAKLPSIGWVKFEPTIGFDSSRNVEFDIETPSNSQEELMIEEKDEREEVIKKEERETRKVTSPTEKGQLFVKTEDFIQKYKNYLFIGMIILFVLSFIIFKLRSFWLPKLYIKFQRKKKFDESSFESYYLNLLKILELKGLKRKDGQTLEVYAKELDVHFKSNHMSRLTKAYERLIYANTSINLNVEELKECWEYLINHSSS